MLQHYFTKIQVKFDGSCLKQEKVTFTHKQEVNIYIVYKINLWPFNVGKDFAFGILYLELLTKNADFDKLNILDIVLDLMQVSH